jgi:spore maturation protein CgeB
MKILYVSNRYDYMNPKRGGGFEHYNFYTTLVQMNNSSNEVITFYPDELIQTKTEEEINKDLLEVAYKEKPDLIFFCAGGGIIKKKTAKELTDKSGAVTMIWMSDDHWAFEKASKYWAPLFNWVTTTDSKAPAKYKKIGCNNVIKTQWACNPEVYKRLGLPKIYDVVFVGHPHSHRKKVFKALENAGVKIEVWGSGSSRGRISQDEMIKVFNQAKICLNFTRSSGILWKELASLFFHRRMYDRKIMINSPIRFIDSLKAFSSTMKTNQIKARNFEISACGSICFTDYADDLGNYYEIGKETVCFDNNQDLINKIKYYLKNEDEREAIAKAGYERTLREHTFEHRFNEMFKTMGLLK